jgi:hypothetical protein
MLAQKDDGKTFSGFLKGTYDSPRKTYIKSHGQAEKTLTRIIIFAVIVLGIVIGISVFHFSHIPLVWKVGISTFILLLPFCLFLQASLNVEAVKDERHSKIENGFRKAYAKYNNALNGNGNKQTITNQDISDDERFRALIRERSLFLMQDSQLYTIYRQAYQLYLSYKKGRICIVGKPDLDELKYGLLQFELDELLNIIVARKMKEDATDFRSYLLPLSFFLFMYFAGFLVVIPLVNAVFDPDGKANTAFIPLFSKDQKIPIIVIQWGFLGGLVYTSISLLNRFLRNDLVPSVYFNAGFRLILSAVVAIVIYFFYMFANPEGDFAKAPPQILLLCFLAGVSPIQFLIHFADTQLSRINEGWKRRDTVGDRPITQLEGIDSVTAERLSEEGLDYVQEMALCNYEEISSKTNYPIELVKNWKDQAILHYLAGDIITVAYYDYAAYTSKYNSSTTNNGTNNPKKEFLTDTLDKKLGIRNISAFIDMWATIDKKDNPVDEQKSFFISLLDVQETDDKKITQLRYLFDNIARQGKQMIDNQMVQDPCIIHPYS